MSPLLNEIIWWTGAGVLGAGACAAAAGAIFGLSVIAAVWADAGARRFYNIADNLYHVHAWRRAGSPRWGKDPQEPGHLSRMCQTARGMKGEP